MSKKAKADQHSEASDEKEAKSETSNLPPVPDNDRCFVITPIGRNPSPIRRSIDGVIDRVIIPEMQRLKLNVSVSHRMFDGGSVNKQVIQRILRDRLVIANLTALNPNVMYELAIRHAACLPVVTIAESGTPLPFDIFDLRTVLYFDDMAGVRELRMGLRKAVKAAIDRPVRSNPVFDASESLVLQEAIKPSSENAAMMEMLKRLVEKGDPAPRPPFPEGTSDTLVENIRVTFQIDQGIGDFAYTMEQDYRRRLQIRYPAEPGMVHYEVIPPIDIEALRAAGRRSKVKIDAVIAGVYARVC